jgi:hypothetical protein
MLTSGFDNGFRVVQFTPPGSGTSIQFGTIVAAVHWNDAVSEENNNSLATLRIGGVASRSSIAGALANVQFMVKDSKKYAATGAWGFGDFTDGKPAKTSRR